MNGNDLHSLARARQKRGWRLLSTKLLALLAMCHLSLPLFASASQTTEAEGKTAEAEAKIKAAYVYNFLKFIEWPQDSKNASTSPFRVCLIGPDPIRTILGELAVRKVRERTIEVAHLKDFNELSSCHLLYVSRSEEQGLLRILPNIQGAPVLLVSDIPQFAHKGGMIGFVTEAQRVRIEINLKSFLQARLKASAKLLEIARIVP